MRKTNVVIIIAAIISLMIMFGCDSNNRLVNDKTMQHLLKTRKTGHFSIVDSGYSSASSIMLPAHGYINSYQSGTSPTIPTTANPASAIAVDGQDIHIYPSYNPQSEVHISVSLANPDNLLASANTNFGLGNSIQGYYYSNDGGTNWYGSDQLPNNALGRGDPSTAFDAGGNGYIETMAAPGVNSNSTNGYLIQKTTNGGVTWQPQVRGDGPVSNFDKPMITADNIPGSPYANNLYAAWSILPTNNYPPSGYKVQFNRSTDGGQTFSNPVTLINDWGQGANVQTEPNGNVYVCWANYGNNNYPANGIGFARSINGGVSFNLDDIAFSYTGIRTGGGPNPAFGGTRVNDYPSMAVDKSGGPYNGRIYIAYAAEGDVESIIYVRYSTDQGTTWSDKEGVSAFFNNTTQHWFPWIAVDQQKGWVSVVYYAIDGSNYQTDTYMATSFNGGKDWYRTKVSDVSHTTAPIPGFRGGYAGDYIGLAAYGGTAYPAWMDNRNGTWQIYVSPVALTPPPPPPLSVFIYGQFEVHPHEIGVWTAKPSGGTPPYQYSWDWRKKYGNAGSPWTNWSFINPLKKFEFKWIPGRHNPELWAMQLKVTVTDADNDQATSSVFTAHFTSAPGPFSKPDSTKTDSTAQQQK